MDCRYTLHVVTQHGEGDEAVILGYLKSIVNGTYQAVDLPGLYAGLTAFSNAFIQSVVSIIPQHEVEAMRSRGITFGGLLHIHEINDTALITEWER